MHRDGTWLAWTSALPVAVVPLMVGMPLSRARRRKGLRRVASVSSIMAPVSTLVVCVIGSVLGLNVVIVRGTPLVASPPIAAPPTAASTSAGPNRLDNSCYGLSVLIILSLFVCEEGTLAIVGI